MGVLKERRGRAFVICAEDHESAALADAEGALVFQALGGLGRPSDPAVASFLELAIASGVTEIVLCAHDGCKADRRAPLARVADQLAALQRSEIGALLTRAGVRIELAVHASAAPITLTAS
jgi:carbonic anhydrase